MRHRTRPVPVSIPWPKRHHGYHLEGGDKKISKTGFGFKGGAEKFSEELIPRPAQRRLQPPLFLIPVGVFGLQLRLDRLDFGAHRGRAFRVLLLRLVQRPLCLVVRLLPACALLCLAASSLASSRSRRRRSRSYACAAFRSAALSGWAEDFLAFAGLRAAFFPPSWPRFFGSSACSPKGPSDPTGRLRTTPGFAMVAAMTSRSWLSFATPWWKRLLSAPHASKAAFIDGAAIACSKKPRDVW